MNMDNCSLAALNEAILPQQPGLSREEGLCNNKQLNKHK